MKWYNEEFGKPEQTQEEFEFLTQNFTKDDTVLEYGSGFSTPNLAPLCGKLWTIEHHPMWYNKVKDMCVEFDNINHVLVEMDEDRNSYIPKDWNTRPEAKYGFPTPFSCVRTYSTWCVDKDIKFDKIFLDGRGRQWIAQFLFNNLKPDTELFVHDYERERYLTIERFYDKVGQVGTMAKFRSKL